MSGGVNLGNFETLCCKNIGTGKSECVAKSQFILPFSVCSIYLHIELMFVCFLIRKEMSFCHKL